MDKETFYKARDLDGKMGEINYLIMTANKIRTAADIRIVEVYPVGTNQTLAHLPKGDKLRDIIADSIIARLEKERAKVQEEFNNL